MHWTYTEALADARRREIDHDARTRRLALRRSRRWTGARRRPPI